MFLRSLLLVLPLLTAAVADTTKEPSWGRIYLRDGAAPIQYFRDGYGGPMVDKEIDFYVPRREEDRLGCEPFPEEEAAVLKASNGSMAIVVDRGVCSFEVKSRNAQAAGATVLVIVSQDESATAPVATNKDDISIATVMIRKTAGDLIRDHLDKYQHVYGRLIPMVCQRTPYVCKAHRAIENTYIAEKTSRSGVIFEDGTSYGSPPLGEFLTASYGGTLPSHPLQIASQEQARVLQSGCTPLEGDDFAGKIVILAGTEGSCSVLDRVSNAQRANASAVLISMSTMAHPAVAEGWQGYNITIVAAVVSPETVAQLSTVAPATGVVFRTMNSIADTWDEIRRLSVKSNWPTRKERKEKLLLRLLSTMALDNGQLLALKHNYIQVAGGSVTTWDQIAKPAMETEDTVQEYNGGAHSEL